MSEVSDKVFEARQLILQNKQSKANKIVKEIRELGTLKPEDRKGFSELLRVMGRTEEGISVLGNELSLNELRIASIDEIRNQIQLAFVLQFMGAKYVALRILRNVGEIINERELSYENIVTYHLILGHTYRGASMPAKALEAYQYHLERIIPLNKLGTESVVRFDLVRALSLDQVGEWKEAIELLRKTTDSLNEEVGSRLIGMIHQYTAEIFANNSQWDSFDQELTQAISYIPKNHKGVENADLNYLKGLRSQVQDHLSSAKKLWLSSYAQYKKVRVRPNSPIKVLYFLEKFTDCNVNFPRKITSRCHQFFSNHALLLGRRNPPGNPYGLPPWIESKINKDYSQFEYWKIFKGEVLPTKDDLIVDEINIKEDNVVDLSSGIISHKGKSTILTPLETEALAAVMACGDLGIHKLALTDFLYQDNFFSIELGRERLKKVLASLKKKGINIKREGLYYNYRPKNDVYYILPQELRYIGRWKFFKRLSPNQLKRRQIENFLDLESSTVNRWLKSWQEEQIIEKVGEGRNSRYLYKDAA